VNRFGETVDDDPEHHVTILRLYSVETDLPPLLNYFVAEKLIQHNYYFFLNCLFVIVSV
jgi:hypothetical protein